MTGESRRKNRAALAKPLLVTHNAFPVDKVCTATGSGANISLNYLLIIITALCKPEAGKSQI